MKVCDAAPPNELLTNFCAQRGKKLANFYSSENLMMIHDGMMTYYNINCSTISGLK